LAGSNRLFRIVAGLAVVFVTGTVGYWAIEGWTWLESLYMTMITVTTIGFGEVHPLSEWGRIFTIFLIAIGFGVVLYAAVTTTGWLIEGEVEKTFSRRKSMKSIEKIKDHFIICGFGRMGSFVAHEFHARGMPFVIVERDLEVQNKVMEAGFLLAPGDATEEDVLRRANIKKARGLVSVLNTDASNVYAVLTAKEFNPSLQVVARAGEDSARKKLMRAGADRVISPYQIGGLRIVMGILKPTVMSFLELAMDHKELNIEIEELQVAENSVYSGKRLVDTGIRKDLNLIIIAVKKKNGEMVFNPGSDTLIEDNDTLITMGDKKNLEYLEKQVARGTWL